ncbi:MAG: hypothetical protein QXM12_04150 [Nitrososphaerota archaeon]
MSNGNRLYIEGILSDLEETILKSLSVFHSNVSLKKVERGSTISIHLDDISSEEIYSALRQLLVDYNVRVLMSEKYDNPLMTINMLHQSGYPYVFNFTTGPAYVFSSDRAGLSSVSFSIKMLTQVGDDDLYYETILLPSPETIQPLTSRSLSPLHRIDIRRFKKYTDKNRRQLDSLQALLDEMNSQFLKSGWDLYQVALLDKSFLYLYKEPYEIHFLPLKIYPVFYVDFE